MFIELCYGSLLHKLQYLPDRVNLIDLPGAGVHGQRGAVHLEASRKWWHHHLAPTSTPRREWTGAPISPNCEGGSLHMYTCVFICGGSLGGSDPTARQTALWFVAAVFTEQGALLIGHATLTSAPRDLPVIGGFCLQPEVTLHRTPCLNPHLNLSVPPLICPSLMHISAGRVSPALK